MRVPFIVPILVLILGIPILSAFRSETLFNILVTIYFVLLTLWYASDEGETYDQASTLYNWRNSHERVETAWR
jgi:hypothetical protein